MYVTFPAHVMIPSISPLHLKWEMFVPSNTNCVIRNTSASNLTFTHVPDFLVNWVEKHKTNLRMMEKEVPL